MWSWAIKSYIVAVGLKRLPFADFPGPITWQERLCLTVCARFSLTLVQHYLCVINLNVNEKISEGFARSHSGSKKIFVLKNYNFIPHNTS